MAERVAIYARVSKEDANSDGTFQDPENQLKPLREFAAKMGWEVTEYVERASGGSNRPIFRELLAKGFRHSFDGILVWSLDRFSREGILDTLTYIDRLKSAGVWLKSLREDWLDTKSQYADLMLAQFAWFAKFERQRISDRTKAALARKKAGGMKLGRPKRCLLCGWSHKATKQCREPKKTLPPVPTLQPA